MVVIILFHFESNIRETNTHKKRVYLSPYFLHSFKRGKKMYNNSGIIPEIKFPINGEPHCLTVLGSLGKRLDKMLKNHELKNLRKFICIKLSQIAKHHSYVFFCESNQITIELRRIFDDIGAEENIHFEFTSSHRNYFIKPHTWKCDYCGKEVEASEGVIIYNVNKNKDITKCEIIHYEERENWAKALKLNKEIKLWDLANLAFAPSELSCAFELLESDATRTTVCRLFLRGYEEMLKINPKDKIFKYHKFPPQRIIAERITEIRKGRGDFIFDTRGLSIPEINDIQEAYGFPYSLEDYIKNRQTPNTSL